MMRSPGFYRMKPVREAHEKGMRTPGRLQDRLARDAAFAVLGRDRELDLVVRQLAPDASVVTFVHGIGGIGKSSLLAALEAEPLTVVVLVDEYDRLRLLDAWLRHTLMPALPDRTRWVMAGRFGPASAWLTTPGWSDSVLALRLDALDEATSRALLARRGVAPDVAPSLVTLARGSPLALELAARRVWNDVLDERAATSVLDALADRYVDDLPAPLRDAVDAMSVLRRATRPVLEAMLERSCDDTFFQQLAELPFVERTDDGLVLHEIVRQAVAVRLARLRPAPRSAAPGSSMVRARRDAGRGGAERSPRVASHRGSAFRRRASGDPRGVLSDVRERHRHRRGVT
jgi:hypothetical protein